ncbi:MAG: hypothetical protein FJY88_12350, partial [Candidatus Eisenbacteria bacterium]|nr:hypothetical protein [Candidatus Eisenbacteria bacterium]
MDPCRHGRATKTGATRVESGTGDLATGYGVAPPADSHGRHQFLWTLILIALFVIWSNSFHSIAYLRR